MYTWSERCRSHARIFLRSGEDVNERWSMIKYWSNSDGELHRHGIEDITEDQLPFMLKKAYNGAYLQVPGLYSYLVETPSGYGISYEMHFDREYVRTFGVSMKEAFDAITNLLTVYRHKPGLRGCDIFLFEDTEWDGHEIIFVVPADVSKKRLKMVSETVIKFEEELNEIFKKMAEERKKTRKSEEAFRRYVDLDAHPKTGVFKTDFYAKLSTKQWLQRYFDGSENCEQVTNATPGKTYYIHSVECCGDVSDFNFIGDDGKECTLGSFFFEPLSETATQI